LRNASKETLSLPEIAVEAYTQREQMEETQKEDVIKLYRKNLSQKMEAALREALGVTTVKVSCQVEEEKADTFGTIQKVDVWTKEDLHHKVVETLHRDFGIHPERITVRYLKESGE
jgi:hypothetical protein